VIRPVFREALIGRFLLILRVIWAALGLAVFVYGALGVWLTRTMKPVFPSDVVAVLRPALYAVAIVTALLTVWRRRALDPERLVAAASAAPTLGMGGAQQAGLAPESDEERRALVVMARLMAQSIPLWAMSESLALYGLLLSVGTADARHVIGLGAATLVLLGMYAPSYGRLEAALAAIPPR